LRVRNRIFEVLRLGTPIRAGYKSMLLRKNNERGGEFVNALPR
jgi:hypothetical protein